MGPRPRIPSTGKPRMRVIGLRVPENPRPLARDPAKRARSPEFHARRGLGCVKSGPACSNPHVSASPMPRNGPAAPNPKHGEASDACNRPPRARKPTSACPRSRETRPQPRIPRTARPRMREIKPCVLKSPRPRARDPAKRARGPESHAERSVAFCPCYQNVMNSLDACEDGVLQ